MACLHLCKASIDCAIYVDTGKTYPETLEMVRYARKFVPVVVVESNQQEQNDREGIPADVVPIEWTRLGQSMTTPKPILIQNYIACCFENIAYPLFQKAKDMGATEIIYGQRSDEGHRATTRNGDVVDGITRLHPIEGWTSEQVFAYLKTVMEVPEHYYLKHSSLDCYDCTAFREDTRDRVIFTKEKYPYLHQQHQVRVELVKQALQASGYMENDHGIK